MKILLCNFSVVSKIKKNLSDSYLKDVSQSSSFPDVEIEEQQHLTARKSLGNVGETKADELELKDNKYKNNIQNLFDSNKKEERSQVNDCGDGVSRDDDKEIIMDKSEEKITPDSYKGHEPYLATTGDLHVSAQIPNDFESLYKKTVSCDDSEPVKFQMSDDSTKEIDYFDEETKDMKIVGFENLDDAGLGRNRSMTENDDDIRIEEDKVIIDDEDEEVDEAETDETEEASLCRENLSLNFDEDNAELLKLEKGLTALCVGRFFLNSNHVI